MSEFQFAEPQYIHGIWPVIATVAGLVWLESRGGRALGRFVSSSLQPQLVSKATLLRRSLRIGLLGLAALSLVAALMRPQWGLEFLSTPRVGAEIMIALDVSKSMLAEDVAPNRLERAKVEIRDLLTYLEGDQVGLIAFAGRASVLCPLTPDFSFLRLVLDNTDIDSAGRGGTRLEEPIRKAIRGFGAAGDLARVILLITDGEDHGSFPLDAAREAAERGVQILAVGFGDENGSQVTLTDPDTGARTILRDSDGQPVISRLDGDLLRELAVITEGAYIPAGTGVLDLESIFDAHIRPLMRAEGEERGRTVRKEAFQWAVLLALLALLGSVATQSVRVKRLAPVLLAAALLAPIDSSAATVTSPPPAPSTAPSTPAADQDAAASEQSQQQEGVDRSRLELPEDPREAYNRGSTLLDRGELDDAERLLERAQTGARGDGEVRFRATYNLGWVDVKRAERSLQDDPQTALRALERAADWFREAVALRPKSELARRNLEIVLQRALALADSLAQREPRDIEARLDSLIAAQRPVTAAIRGLVELVGQRRDDPNATDSMRPQFKHMAVEERTVLSQASGLAQLAGQELDSLQAVSQEDLSPQDRMRTVQLTGLLRHLHRGRERIGQARRQLRHRQAERSYRRAAAGLSALKRARDQLRDPVRILEEILNDAGQLGGETQRLAAARSAVELGGQAAGRDDSRLEAPPWLTAQYLAETQDDLAQRTGELHERLEAGLDQAEGLQDPEQLALLEQVGEAEPYVEQARVQFELAAEHLEAGEVPAAGQAQLAGIAALIQARERFLNLKGLIETAYADEKRIEALLDTAETEGPAALGEYAEALQSFQASNLERTRRMAPLINRERANLESQAATAGTGEAENHDEALQAQRERLDTAEGILTLTESAMERAVEKLSGLANSPESLEQARHHVQAALQGLTNLRRIFFSIVEHLRETLERQIELGDQTEDTAASAAAEPDRASQSAARLATHQSELADFTEELAQTLHQQSLEDPAEMAGVGDEASAEETTQRLVQASEFVILASDEMSAAAQELSQEAPDFDELRTRQDVAVEDLAKALTLLQPPEPQEGQPEQDDERQEQQQGQSQGETDEGQPDQEAQAPEQLLQAVRDREAERHRRRSGAGQQRYEPVEKDW